MSVRSIFFCAIHTITYVSICTYTILGVGIKKYIKFIPILINTYICMNSTSYCRTPNDFSFQTFSCYYYPFMVLHIYVLFMLLPSSYLDRIWEKVSCLVNCGKVLNTLCNYNSSLAVLLYLYWVTYEHLSKRYYKSPNTRLSCLKTHFKSNLNVIIEVLHKIDNYSVYK